MTALVKYPKTMHLPWSPGLQNDDRLIEDLDAFKGRWVIITEKMDGENATLYRDHYHARSLNSRHHPSRDWIKAFHGQVRFNIPEGWRVCGENCYAKHSIFYEDLADYFFGFSIWGQRNICQNWTTTYNLFRSWGITPAPILWSGEWNDFERDHEEFDEFVMGSGKEGYVVRVWDEFPFSDFQKKVAKFVRKDHIQTDEHWMAGPVIPNKLRRK